MCACAVCVNEGEAGQAIFNSQKMINIEKGKGRTGKVEKTFPQKSE